MSKLVSKYSLSGILDRPINDYERAVMVLNAEESHVVSCEDTGHFGTEFMGRQIFILFISPR